MRWKQETEINAELIAPRIGFSADRFMLSRPWKPFAAATLAFAEDFSTVLLKDPRARRHPEAVALGFWMRKANLHKIRSRYDLEDPSGILLGRGVALHIAPANVDTMFIYSLFLSLFAGNTNVVRISTRRNPQLELVLEALNAVLERHPAVADRMLVVRYGHDDAVTGFFSGLCDLRVLWGGNETVRRMRAIPIPAHAVELAFSGKFSVAVFDATAWLGEADRDGVVRRFCNDAFSFNQQGCACPKLVYWLGNASDTEAAGVSFWETVERVLPTTGFAIEPAEAMDRLVAECAIAVTKRVAGPACRARSGLFTRLAVSTLSDVSRELNTGNGLFYEFSSDSLMPLLEWFGADDQTVASYGIGLDTWNTVISEATPRGICRVVKLGQALEFSPVWDGFDLVRSMCRLVRIEV